MEYAKVNSQHEQNKENKENPEWNVGCHKFNVLMISACILMLFVYCPHGKFLNRGEDSKYIYKDSITIFLKNIIFAFIINQHYEISG